MTSFQLPPAIFTENAITRAERAYQQNVSETSPRQRWINRAIKGIVAAYALLQLGILLVASLTQTNPVPIAGQLLPFSALLVIIVIYYHFYLMFQAITLSANSIMREKEYKKAWETLVRSGVHARQIVWGKWWVTVQGLLPRYLLLGVLRVGGTAAVGMLFLAVLVSELGNNHIQSPHPMTILVASLLAILLTVANLGFSAACGIMSAAVGKVTSPVIELGFVSQAVMSLVPAIMLMFIFYRPAEPLFQSIYFPIAIAGASLADNGFSVLSLPLMAFSASNDTSHYSATVSLTFYAALLTLIFYIVLIVFALRVAERGLKRSLVNPSS
ncbi:MAG: hypothetical protein H0X30_11475 [Anaerolineae bacterium]|nr:hypothetical protein [Anaerolineae bacterium]